MRSRLFSWLSILLIVGGVILPGVMALAVSASDYWVVTSSGPTYQNGNSVWTYTVTSVGHPRDISHLSIAVCENVGSITASPAYESRGNDPSLGLSSVLKWDVSSLSGSGTVITVTYAGLWATGSQSWWVKAGRQEDAFTGVMSGPACTAATPNFTVNKKVSKTNDAATGQSSITLENGGNAYYFYTFSNTGSVPLTIATAVDDVLGPVTFTPSTVAPGGTATATATKLFPSLTAGSATQQETNTVTVTATFNGTTVGPKAAQATVVNQAPAPAPSFTVSKRVGATSDPTSGQASLTLTSGGTVHYFYTVTNTGNVPLTLVSASDDKLGAITFTSTSLPVGGSATGSATKTFSALAPDSPAVTEVNEVTVTARYGNTVLGPQKAQASVTVQSAPGVPGLTVTKLVSTTSNPATGQPSVNLTGGGDVHYFYTVTNTGNVPVTISSAVDDKLGNIAFAPQTVPVGGSATGHATKTFPALAPSAAAETEVNTITVTGSYRDVTVGPLSAQAAVTNNPRRGEVGFTVTKKVSASNDSAAGTGTITLHGGGTAYYFYTITNTGEFTLDLTSATDDKLGPLSFTPTMLRPGETATATASKSFGAPTVTETEINTATVIMNNDGVELPAQQATASVTNNPAPSFQVTKRVGSSSNPAAAGAEVTLTGGGTAYYFYTVTNTSSVELTIGSAVDDVLGTIAFAPTVLAPGATATGTATKTFPALAAGTAPTIETNTLSVTVTYGGKTLGPQTASARVTNLPEAGRPDFTLTKTVSSSNNPASGQAIVTFIGGGTAYYFYTVTNTGNVPLVITSATDDRLGALGFPTGALNPGQSATASTTKNFPGLAFSSPEQREINTATVTASYGEVVLTRTAQATVVNRPDTPPPPPPAVTNFTVTKKVSQTADPATGQASISLSGGGTAYYFYTVTNTGDTVLTITDATDDQLGALHFSPATLNPGQTATATTSKVFSALPAGSTPMTEVNVVNVWSTSGGTRYGPRSAQAAVVNNPVPARPEFTVEKLAGTSADAAAGRTIVTLVDGGTVHYFFTVTNTGNVPLTISKAVDDRLGPVSLTPGTIPPGGKATGTLTKTFGAVRAESRETNTISVWTRHEGRELGPQTSSATVVNTPSPKGTVEVLVLDGSSRNPAPVPIRNALVKLSNGREGLTDQNGRISFTDLSFGAYEAEGTSDDPQRPGTSERKRGSGSTTISREKPDGTITITLRWEYPPPAANLEVKVCETFSIAGGVVEAKGPGGMVIRATQPGPDGRYHLEGLIPGAWQVALLAPGLPAPVTQNIIIGTDPTYSIDTSLVCPALTGSITGRICAPPPPGAEITAQGPGGNTASTSVPSNGRLGEWRNYGLNDLKPGPWVLTLKVPGKRDATQTVTVAAGESTAAEDFSLACTGSGPNRMGYLLGAGMVMAGLVLQVVARRRLA